MLFCINCFKDETTTFYTTIDDLRMIFFFNIVKKAKVAYQSVFNNFNAGKTLYTNLASSPNYKYLEMTFFLE